MTAAELLLKRLKAEGIHLYVSGDGETLHAGPRSALTAEHRARLRENKWQLISALHGEEIENLCNLVVEMRKNLAETGDKLRYEEFRRQAAELSAEIAHSTLRNHQQPVAIPEDIRRILVLLTHPDRHDNSPAATKATAWLNGLARGRM